LTALDAATIDQLQGAVGAVVLVRLIDRYVEFAGEKSTALAAAADTGDLATVGRIAHMIAGTAGSIGFVALGEAARAIQSAARAPDGDAERTLAAARRIAAATAESVAAALALAARVGPG
ncbi:MAG: Hpt domain-containing protein, partial [Alphaproteobacteria bacterium]|nr:Hpt domain-containing protein [Alphaproteobacteria bacterium]